MSKALNILCGLALMAATASAEQAKPLPDADVQARCDAEGGCVLVTQAWLDQQAKSERDAVKEAAAACRRLDV